MKTLTPVPSMPEIGRLFSGKLSQAIQRAAAHRRPADLDLWCAEELPYVVGRHLRVEVYGRLSALVERWRELANENETIGPAAARLVDAQRACAQDLEDAIAGHAYHPADRVDTVMPRGACAVYDAFVHGSSTAPDGFSVVRVMVPTGAASSLLSGQVVALRLQMPEPQEDQQTAPV